MLAFTATNSLIIHVMDYMRKWAIGKSAPFCSREIIHTSISNIQFSSSNRQLFHKSCVALLVATILFLLLLILIMFLLSCCWSTMFLLPHPLTLDHFSSSSPLCFPLPLLGDCFEPWAVSLLEHILCFDRVSLYNQAQLTTASLTPVHT